jgi:Protein of unknown function (DUF1569)
MESLYSQSVLKKFINRIGQLTPETQGLWGKMDVVNMLAHCSAVLDVAFENKPFKISFTSLTYGMVSRIMIFNDFPFMKGLPTIKLYKPARLSAFEEERKRLIALLERFSHEGTFGMEKRVHPIFGKLSAQSWNQMQYKHLDHHLRQFGV